MPEEWTAWVLESAGAIRVGRAVCAAVAVGLSVAVAIVPAGLGRGRAIDGITLLLVPAIPTLVAGQLWGKTAFPAITSGTPAPPTRRCPYRLVEGGNYTCVSRSKLVAAAAGEQPFVAPVFAGFFAIQLGMAAAELSRRRIAATPALA